MGREHCPVGEGVLCRQHHSGMGSAKAWVLIARVYSVLLDTRDSEYDDTRKCMLLRRNIFLLSLCCQIKISQNTVIKTSINGDSTEYMCTVY